MALCIMFLANACAQGNSSEPVKVSVKPASEKVLRTGAECMERYLPLLEGKRVALCGNQTSVVGHTHLVDTLLSKKVRLVKLFRDAGVRILHAVVPIAEPMLRALRAQPAVLLEHLLCGACA